MKDILGNVWNFIKQFNYIQLGLVVLVGRSLVVGASIGDALVFIAISGLLGFTKWLGDIKNKSINDRVLSDIQEMKATIAGTQAFGKRSDKGKSSERFWG